MLQSTVTFEWQLGNSLEPDAIEIVASASRRHAHGISIAMAFACVILQTASSPVLRGFWHSHLLLLQLLLLQWVNPQLPKKTHPAEGFALICSFTALQLMNETQNAMLLLSTIELGEMVFSHISFYVLHSVLPRYRSNTFCCRMQ